jgi:hypothetical protein
MIGGAGGFISLYRAVIRMTKAEKQEPSDS